MTDRPLDAYTIPRRIQPGCQHQLGCKCDPPYWLRDPTPVELTRWFVPMFPKSGASNS